MEQVLAGRRVLVVGMARSGVSAARLARRLGASVTCTDTRADAPAVEGCAQVYGAHRREDFLGADLIVVSPGVPAAQPDLLAAREAGVEVVGELGFAAAHLRAPIVAVTGTNGKSSVTWFTAQLLEQAGRRVFAGGNLGTPLSEAVGEDWDVAVVEVSSYQLELPGALHPVAAALLNLTPDHLGRHGTMAGYAAAKARLLERMGPEDTAVLPPDDPWLAPLGRTTRARVLWIDGSPGARVREDALALTGTRDDGTLSLAGLALPGAHNRRNVAAAALLAVSAGAPRAALDLARLRPLPHRLELVAEHGGVRWINDSKATNIEAAQVGIAGVGGTLVVLLGGQGKEGADYSALRPALAGHARAIVCFGASGPEIAEALEGLPVEVTPTMAAAMRAAARQAVPGDAVLLSPACASFDEFRDFEHRGRVFAELAKEGRL